MNKCISRTCAVYMSPGLVLVTTATLTAGRGYGINFAINYHKPIMPCT